MPKPLAHSAKPEYGVSKQYYCSHVGEVRKIAGENAQEAGQYFNGGKELFIETVRIASEFHDLGKLDKANQVVLENPEGKGSLHINHVDAGVACLLKEPYRNGVAATLINAHHRPGLPDYADEQVNAKSFLRDKKSQFNGKSLIEHTDENLSYYLDIHRKALKKDTLSDISKNKLPRNSLLFRLALSCLVDADHFDTSRHYNHDLPKKGLPLHANKRLKLLDAYVAHLKEIQQNKRTTLRMEVYQACRKADTTPNMYACDSPVGTGKTTAVMAHLLNVAKKKKLRRIFVVLPFTNIIDQSVNVYRQALVGLNERREDIVAAHHHRAEFESPELRQYSFLWHAPIVVTTAVQFFETLSNNRPVALRKLHNLPGSAIFIDEAHAALPSYLWPQAWLWLKELSANWGCHIVLGSGSLNRFWQLEEFSNPPMELPELVSSQIRSSTIRYEDDRIKYAHKADPFGLDDLTGLLKTLPGPRLLIVNTVQSAAVIADAIRNIEGRPSVEHLSTALCPRDRKITLDRVKNRLAKQTDGNWTLVATSCVEAGVDLSFHTGLRERCSFNSLIQTGGRINRKGEYEDSIVWDLKLRHGSMLLNHKAFETSSRVLGELIAEQEIRPDLATEAMKREIRSDGLRQIGNEILSYERNLQFPQVAESFKVIDSKTITVIVNENLKQKILKREKIDFNEIQQLSVQIWFNKESKYDLQAIDGFPELRFWNLLYDGFLGYMAGVLPILKQDQNGYSCG